MSDAYEIALALRQYQAKNGYAMRVTSPEIGLLGADVPALERNGIVEVLPALRGRPEGGRRAHGEGAPDGDGDPAAARAATLIPRTSAEIVTAGVRTPVLGW